MKAISAAIILLWISGTVQAAELQWVDDEGTTFSLADFKGKPLLLHFWASWCPPCREEMPMLDAWVNAHREVAFVPVTLDVNINDAIAFLKAKRISMPALQANSEEVSRLGVRGLPATVIIGTDGEVLKLLPGTLQWDDEDAIGAFLSPLDVDGS